MGNTVNSTLLREESSTILKEALESHPILQQYKLEASLVPGSGRLMRTYRLRHHASAGGGIEATAVVKATILEDNSETERLLQDQQRELERIKVALANNSTESKASHIAPFVTWLVGDLKPYRGVKLRAAFLLRPHMYTTLSDRLASRPWLTHVEKVWITHQLLTALRQMHESGIVHGCLTTENIGLTSLNHLVLVDISSSYKVLNLPDDDPTDYLYYFQLQHHDPLDATVKRSEKRCYLAPERFGSKNNLSEYTPAMDVFSAGCVLTELFLNGERCMDLGDVIEYRRSHQSTGSGATRGATNDTKSELPPPIQQKLAKIESSHMRAACRHMLRLDPATRVSAHDYWLRLHAAGQFPDSFTLLMQLLEQMNDRLSPDARIALAASCYDKVLWETVGRSDDIFQQYLNKALGEIAVTGMNQQHTTPLEGPETSAESTTPSVSRPETTESKIHRLFAETEELLRRIETSDETDDPVKKGTDCVEKGSKTEERTIERSELCQSSLLIYLQLVLSTMQHVQRPASKLVAIRLVERLAKYSCDEARLQRIVPVAISLLQDQDPLVRASVLQTVTYTLSVVETFSPSDSKIFPQYIFKRVSPMISDSSLVVRIAFAKCVSILAETALRFLDISHAVRLYEALGSNTGVVTPDDKSRTVEVTANVFTDEVTRLLDADGSQASKVHYQADDHSDSADSRMTGGALSNMGKTLISSTYSADLTAIQETVSRWVVHITTDQSDYSTLPKRALLADLGRLGTFFGVEGVMTFILPQILAFLNERKNWELRAALLGAIPSVCHIVGRAATEEFVVPCVEIGLVDVHETVICEALACLSSLIQMNLISRAFLLGESDNSSCVTRTTLLGKYAALLVHPSGEIRSEAVNTFSIFFSAIGSPSCEVHVMPLLLPLLRFQPSADQMRTPYGLQSCLIGPWSRHRWQIESEKFMLHSPSSDAIHEAWTSIGIQLQEGRGEVESDKDSTNPDVLPRHTGEREEQLDPQLAFVQEYLRMLGRHTSQHVVQEKQNARVERAAIASGIEGSIKLAQSIMFPRQDLSSGTEFVPDWYGSLRNPARAKKSIVSREAAIRSVSDLGHVFGLSIMGPTEGATENIVGAAASARENDQVLEKVLGSQQAKDIEAAFRGQWGSETLVEPDVVDTTLLVAKLKAFGVPPLPPNLGQLAAFKGARVPLKGSTKDSLPSDWRPRMSSLVASSSLATGHSAPVIRLAVSGDNSFFVSGSHDGTCRIWEIDLVEDSMGTLESSTVYSGHCNEGHTRVNDVAMIEGTSSIVSGSSDGSLHVWRVDTVAPVAPRTTTSDHSRRQERPKVVGSTDVRKVHPNEGEVFSVAHFNSLSASVVTFGTQKGRIHSLDLRSGREPFCLNHGPELGHLTSTVLGMDRQWIVSGTSRGFIALWDIRFQQPLKLWRHKSRNSITRLATSVVAPPQAWGMKLSLDRVRPFIFAASGSNECSMFDSLTGFCCEAFRTTYPDGRDSSTTEECPPSLDEVRLSQRRGSSVASTVLSDEKFVSPCSSANPSINCMVGSIGGHNQSYLITGGSDRMIRFWDFTTPSKCYIISGHPPHLMRPSFERLDFTEKARVMLCRMPGLPSTRKAREVAHSNPQHTDSINDLKIVERWGLISCSRDCTIKIWR